MAGRAQIWDGAQWVSMTGGAGEGGGTETDHANLTNVQPSQHHSKYLDSEAVFAMGSKSDGNPLHHDRYTDAEALAVAEGLGGRLLFADYQSGTNSPGGSPTTLLTSVVSGLGGVPLVVDVQGALRSSAMAGGEGFQAQINIDGSAFMNARTEFPANSSHTHTQNSHLHSSGSYITSPGATDIVGSSGSTTPSLNNNTAGTTDGESVVTPIGLRAFTPAGNFDVLLVAEIRSGSPATWFQSLVVKVFAAP